jgi:HlyD family secretion protein
VLSGITEGENLIYSLKGVAKSEASTSAKSESPFMPQRPGGNKKK